MAPSYQLCRAAASLASTAMSPSRHERCRADDGPSLERSQDLVRPLQWMGLDPDLQRHAGREGEEFLGVAPREIRYAAYHPLFPEQPVRKRRDVAHVDPPQTTTPAFRTARSACGTSAPTGAKRIAASRGAGGSSSDEPAHTAPSSSARCCASRSPGEVNA